MIRLSAPSESRACFAASKLLAWWAGKSRKTLGRICARCSKSGWPLSPTNECHRHDRGPSGRRGPRVTVARSAFLHGGDAELFLWPDRGASGFFRAGTAQTAHGFVWTIGFGEDVSYSGRPHSQAARGRPSAGPDSFA